MKKSMYELVSEWRQEVSEEIGATDGGTDHDHAMLYALQTVLDLLDSDPSSVMQPPPEPFTLPVVLCPDCGHGIDPHGLDPGGPCGVNRCSCLWTPNDIAAISAEVFKKADRYDALRARVAAAARLLLDSGDITPAGARVLNSLLDEVQP